MLKTMLKCITAALYFLATPSQATVEVSPTKSNPITTLTDAATIIWDANQGSNYRVTLAGERTMSNPTGLVTGQMYSLAIIQDSTGSRLLHWGSTFRFNQSLSSNVTAPYLTTSANAIDYILFFYDGTYLNEIAFQNDISSPLNKPTGVTASTNVTGHVNLAWTDNCDGETGYIIFENGSSLGLFAANLTSYNRTVSAGTRAYTISCYHNNTVGPFGDGTTSISDSVNGTSL